MTSTTAADNLLTAQGVSAFYGSRPVVNGINLSLTLGDFAGLAGPNGAGKTTLLHCLTGYHAAAAGTVHLAGHPIAKMSRAQIARHIAFVPQFTESVYGFSVREMVLMGRFPYGGMKMAHSAANGAIADAALDELNAAHLRARQFNELSGGERQLVLLARAIVQAAPILIMDEPLTGLDLRHQFQVMEALHRLSQRPGAAVLATFHDLQAAARWCSRLILLKSGTIAAEGPPRQVLTPQLLENLYGVRAKVGFSEHGDFALSVSELAPHWPGATDQA